MQQVRCRETDVLSKPLTNAVVLALCARGRIGDHAADQIEGQNHAEQVLQPGPAWTHRRSIERRRDGRDRRYQDLKEAFGAGRPLADECVQHAREPRTRLRIDLVDEGMT